ncbi:MAG: TetR family transcriptional regulator [Actinomycetota bacterium]|nr:TetR family transcriptional regulator [Actinomycetota bacterium]
MSDKENLWDLEGFIKAFEEDTGSYVTRAQVRRYVREGLLPQPEEGELFAGPHLERLRMVEHLRSKYGMSSEDISGIFGVVATTPPEAVGGEPVEKQAMDRKQRITTNASQLFAARGYHGTTIDDIVQATGIAKGTFYIYFDSKEALLVEVMKQLVENTLLQIDRKLESRKTDSITNIEIKGREFLELYMGNNDLLYVLFGETVGNSRIAEQLKEVYQKLAKTVEEDLREGVEEGLIYPYKDLKTISYALVGMGQTVALLLSVSEELQLDQARKTVYKFMQRAFHLADR